MVVWQGWGILAGLIPIVIGVISEVIFDNFLGKGWFKLHPWVFSSTLLFSAICVWFIGKWLNNKPGKILLDPGTGEQVEFKRVHTIFWIPMQWFSLVLVAIAVFYMFR